MSRIYSLERVQFIQKPISEVWRFFSNPLNLEKITPASMSFTVSSKSVQPMYKGQIIEYKVSPLFGIKLYWMTEITEVQKHHFFVDEQRHGPFSFWHHQHHFAETDKGIKMTDILHYKIPFWFIGDIANSLIVSKKLKEIFDFREKKITDIFNN